MKTIFLKKLRTKLVIITTLFFATQAPNISAGYGNESPYSSHTDQIVENMISETYKHLKIQDEPGKHTQTQTLAYLDRYDLRANLNTTYSDKMKEIGITYFKDMFKTIFKNELDHHNTHRVFYHGQMREFALLQDLYKGLYNIAFKKSIRDFILLRVPNKDFFSKFKNVNDFLHHYIENGEIRRGGFNYSSDDIKKRLLSVNPSLFSNTNCSSSCSFYYFLHSESCTSINMLNTIQELFQFFNFENYFSQYEEEIRELNTLLSDSEKGKTGILLQMFIPEKLVDTIAYHSVSGGCLYHTDENPEKHPATKDLDNYKNSADSLISGSSFDETQFRLLINKAMLDPNSGIKFIRFWNQTNTIKKYKEKLKELLDKIEADVKKQATK